MLDVAFTIVTGSPDWTKTSPEELVAALQRRIDYLRANPVEATEAYGYSDTYEVYEEEAEDD